MPWLRECFIETDCVDISQKFSHLLPCDFEQVTFLNFCLSLFIYKMEIFHRVFFEFTYIKCLGKGLTQSKLYKVWFAIIARSTDSCLISSFSESPFV